MKTNKTSKIKSQTKKEKKPALKAKVTKEIKKAQPKIRPQAQKTAVKKIAKRVSVKKKIVAQESKVILQKETVVKEEIVKHFVPQVRVIKPKEAEKQIPVSVEKPKEVIKPSIVTKVEPKPVIVEEKPKAPAAEKTLKPLELDLPITVKDLAIKLAEKPSILIKYLIEKQKTFVTINQLLEEEIVKKTLENYGFEYKKIKTDEELLFESHVIGADQKFLTRPPVITLMGHVDHGKTSLLDAIRRSRLVDKEHGGITQHIGAYAVNTRKGKITFLDTPGHEAFTAMRARGANITDIVILVVAADDGIMPQTIEAIDHAKAAKVPIVVAINKIDKPDVDIDKVKRQLSKYDLSPEDWGGKTVTVGVSAKTGQGIDDLLEMILLEAELLELKAVYDRPASGVVIEAKLSKGQGPVTTVLVQSGTLIVGDNIICGVHYGKIRAMISDLDERVDKITPGMPAEVLGLSGLPEAGEKFYVLNDEKKLKEIISERQSRERERHISPAPKHISLEDIYSKIQNGEVRDLNLILKADVQGSLEAIRESLNKIESQEVKMQILHSGVGPINSSDVILAEASNAIIIGFHVEPDSQTKEMATNKKVEIRTYRIIYDLLNEIKQALEGLLAPKIKKVFIGRAEVRRVFNLTKSGLVAGCFVQRGKILRQANVSLIRGEQVLFEGSLAALKRFKDDVREVAEGFECGISLAGFTDYKEGDIIEAYSIEKIARKL